MTRREVWTVLGLVAVGAVMAGIVFLVISGRIPIPERERPASVEDRLSAAEERIDLLEMLIANQLSRTALLEERIECLRITAAMSQFNPSGECVEILDRRAQ